jgi:hypothetical protein
MSLIVFGSGRSPGLTTAVHAMAMTWPRSRRCLIAELDPDGGVFAGRHAIPSDPGLVSLAAAGRRGFDPVEILGHCRQLAGGTPALLGPTAPDRAASALATLGPGLGVALNGLPGFDVLADCGRLDGRSPVLEIVSAAPYALLVVEPTVEGVAHLEARLGGLPLPAGRVALVLVGDRPYPPAEVGCALHLPVLGVIARDARGAVELAEGRPRWRSPLLRSAAVVTAALVAHLPPLPADTDTTDAPDGAGSTDGDGPTANQQAVTAIAAAAGVPDVDPLGGRQARDRRWP